MARISINSGDISEITSTIWAMSALEICNMIGLIIFAIALWGLINKWINKVGYRLWCFGFFFTILLVLLWFWFLEQIIWEYSLYIGIILWVLSIGYFIYVYKIVTPEDSLDTQTPEKIEKPEDSAIK